MANKPESQFRKIVLQVQVLCASEEDADMVRNADLAELHYLITDGPCSGDMTIETDEAVTPRRMVKLLEAQGSDPSFFQLDGKGNVIED